MLPLPVVDDYMALKDGGGRLGSGLRSPAVEQTWFACDAKTAGLLHCRWSQVAVGSRMVVAFPMWAYRPGVHVRMIT